MILFNLLRILVIASFYLLLAQSGMLFANHHGAVTLWWPCGGFALAVMLLVGLHYLPGIFIGAFITSLSFGDPIFVAGTIALGNSLEAAFGYWLLTRKLKLESTLNRLRDFLVLLLVASPLIALIGTLIDTSALIIAGIVDKQLWLKTAIHWWMADLLGIVLITPLFLVWQQAPINWLNIKRLVEVFLILGITFLAGQMVFLEWGHEYFGHYPKGFMIFLFLTVTAIRLGRHGTTIVIIMTTVQALLGASLKVGYFSDDIELTHLTNFWLYALVLSVSGMVLAAYITEKNQVVKALYESENRFRTLANNTSALVWMSDTNGLCIYFNKVWLNFTGRSLIEELGNGWRAGIHPEDLQNCIAIYTAAFDTRKEFNLEYRLLRYNSEYRWMIGHGAPRYDDQGIFLGYIGSLFDITDLKNAQAAMYDSEIRFRHLLDKIPLVSVQSYAADGTTIYWNQASEQLYGYTAEEALGKNLVDLIIPPELRTTVIQAMHNMFATGQPIAAAELRLMHKNGERIEVFSSHAYVHVPSRAPEMFCMDIDLTERKRAEEQIRQLAFYDPLTQLPNRRLLMDRIQQALAESQRKNNYGALLFFDLDNFKALNDTLGHDKGDLLLQQVAHRLVDSVRTSDTVARLGGDEFVVMLKDLNEQLQEAAFQAEIACEKMLQTLNQPYLLADILYHSTPSIGIALFTNHHLSVEDLMKRADIAMYQAKQNGRNTFRFFDPEMQSAVEARAILEDGLRKALPEHQFVLYYQVQVDHIGHSQGAEVLLRWNHPDLGLILPAEFIPLAEETGLIVPIGLWVLDEVCAQLKRWENHPQKQHLQLAVNVSARQFRQTDFIVQVISILERSGINPTRLKLELTESLLLENVHDVIKKMQQLKLTGIQFSMDDFGTGYSSLSYLKKLPIDQLKIDQSFVRDIATDPDDAMIIKTIIAMADHLGMNVIAEGVENDQQKAFLMQHRCENFQGNLFGKPMPLEEFEMLIANYEITLQTLVRTP